MAMTDKQVPGQGGAMPSARATGPSDLSPASGSSRSSVPIAAALCHLLTEFTEWPDSELVQLCLAPTPGEHDGEPVIAATLGQLRRSTTASPPDFASYLEGALALFDADPADSDHQRGYLAALVELQRVFSDEQVSA